MNLTTWVSVQALADFVFSGRHLEIMRRRREWFKRAVEPMTALCWVPAGHRPSTDDAEARVRHLRSRGPSAQAFTFRMPFPSPGAAGVSVSSDDGWFCPALACPQVIAVRDALLETPRRSTRVAHRLCKTLVGYWSRESRFRVSGRGLIHSISLR